MKKETGELLSALLDGELEQRDRARAEEILRQDADARLFFEDLRRNQELLQSLPRHEAPPSILGDVQAHTERSALLDDVHSTADGHTLRVFKRLVPLAAAASLMFAVIAGWWYLEYGLPGAARRQAAAPLAEVAREKTTPDVRQLDAKIGSSLALADLRSHPFAVEPVRLEISIASASRQSELVSRLAKELRAAGVADVSAGESDRAAGAVSSSAAFFMPGRAGVNYSSETSQVLVRAPASQVAQVIDRLQDAEPAAAIQLRAGALTVDGPRRAKDVLFAAGGVESRPEPSAGSLARPSREFHPAEVEAKKAEPPPADQEFLTDLLKNVGIDPAALAKKESADDAETSRAPVPGKLAARRQGDLERRSAVGGDAKGLAEDASSPSTVANSPAAIRSLSAPDAAKPDSRSAEQFLTLIIEIKPPSAPIKPVAPEPGRSSRPAHGEAPTNPTGRSH